MFAACSWGGQGEHSGNWPDQQPDRVLSGVTSAGSLRPSHNFSARNTRILVDTTAPPAAGGRGADCQCFSVSCSSRPHWSAAAATKPAGPPAPPGHSLACQVLPPAAHLNRTLHWQGSTLALPGRRQGGRGSQSQGRSGLQTALQPRGCTCH